MSIGIKCAQSVYCKPTKPKRKLAPTSGRMPNASAEVVLRERKVEIKDLESQVIFLQNQIKTLRVENKTLRDMQIRHEKELRKFREGVADIPSLLRSHKDEVKALESNTSALRRELRECQKELKSKCDNILRKDQQIEKLNTYSKRNERHLQEVGAENKELKSEKKKLEEDCKKFSGNNEELKSKNDRFQKKIQQMTTKILNLEESLGTSDHHKTQLKEDLSKLQKNYDELQQSINSTRLQPTVITIGTQTDSLNYLNNPYLISKDSKYYINSEKEKLLSENLPMVEDGILFENKSDDYYNMQKAIGDPAIPLDQVYYKFTQPITAESKLLKPLSLKPGKSKSSFSAKNRELIQDLNYEISPYFSLNSPYLSSNICQSNSALKCHK